MLVAVLKQRIDMLFAHAGHSYGAEVCCSKAALVIAVVALAVSVAALIIALKKNKKK